jgi:hypothetical protein
MHEKGLADRYLGMAEPVRKYGNPEPLAQRKKVSAAGLPFKSCAAAKILRDCGFTAEAVCAGLAPPPPPLPDPEQGRYHV